MIRIAACFLVIGLAGCVSSTSGPPKPEPDKDDAAEFNYQLGARYYRNGKFDLARDRLKLSIDFDPRRAVTWSTLALTYEALGNPRLALESYEQAVRVDPRNYDAHNAYAVYLCRQGQFDKAARHFERAADITENDRAEYTLTNAGVCMVQKPDIEKAESFFRQALEERTNHPEALLQMTLLKVQTEDYLGARAFVQRYLSSQPATASMLLIGVRVEDELGDERAKREFEDRLLREFPTSPEARRILESD